MAWTRLTFGKHKGKTLPQIVFSDPDWFFWAWENEIFDTPVLRGEVTRINERARRIRIPNDGGVDRIAEYIIHPATRNVTDVDFVPKSQTHIYGAGGAICRDVIDLSVPRSVQSYDKMGGRLVIQAVKPLLFPGVGRVTRQLLDAFFDDDNNFVI